MRGTGCTAMSTRIPALVLALLHATFAASAQLPEWRTLQLEGGLELRLQEIEPNRATPSDHVRQGVETIGAQGRERVLLARPLGSLGGEPRVLYSLLARTDRTPSPQVRISGEVLIGQRAFAWQAEAGSDRWQEAVLQIVEALAQLPARHAAQPGLLDPDRAKAPVTFTTSAITFERLAGPVTVDGRSWLAANVIWPGGKADAPDGVFQLALPEVDDAGDVSRGRPMFSARGSQPVALSAEPVAYALISKDARWIFLEPLVAIRTDTWRRYELGLQYGLEPYVVPQAVSPDGRRIVFSRRDCAVDCAGAATEYFELTLPWIP